MDSKKLANQCIQTYNNNLKLLKKHYPDLAVKVETQVKTKYKLIFTNKNVFNLELESNKKYYSEENTLYSVKTEIDSLNLKNTRIAVFLGMGLGYEVLYFLQELAAVQRTEKVIIVEKDLEIFCYALHTIDMKPIITNKKILLWIDCNSAQIYDLFCKQFDIAANLVLTKAVNPVYIKSGFELHKDYYLEVLQALKKAILFKYRNIGNSPDDSLLGLKNMFINIDEIISHPGINMLFSKFKDKPAIVVASGPSLKKNIHLLKAYQNHALIICAESTYRILTSNGIKPHIVCSLERTQRTKNSFEGFTVEDMKDTYLAACPVIPKEAYDVYEGPRLVVYRQFDHFKWLEIEKGMLNIAQSSANMAFKVATALGANPVVLVGQDLAFAEDDESTHFNLHPKGARQDRYYGEKKIEVEGNNGGTVFTSQSWYNFLLSYEADVSNYNGLCINATEGGAKIKGTQIMPLKEVAEIYMKKEIHPLDIIRNSIAQFSVENIRSDYERLHKKAIDACKEIELILERCKEIIDLIDDNKERLEELINKENLTDDEKKEVIKLYNMIHSTRQEITSDNETFQLLVMHIVQSFFIKTLIDINALPANYDIFEKGIAEGIIKMKHFFGVINNLTVIVYEEVKVAQERLSIKLTN